MSVKLNPEALKMARSMIKAGKVARDDRGDWSDHQQNPNHENSFLKSHGYGDYSLWHLGLDKQETRDTKGRFSFPFGDFSRVHRCAIIAIESRAAQNDYDDIAKAARELLELIDATPA